MSEIPNFLKGKSGLLVESLSFGSPVVLTLSILLDGDSRSEDAIPEDLPAYLASHQLDFAVLHNIRIEDKKTILAAIRHGYPVLYVPTAARMVPKLLRMYNEFNSAGAVPIGRLYDAEKIITALVRNFKHTFSIRD